MDRNRLRPSPALVIGTTALVVALSGSAVAATGVGHTHYRTNSIPSRAIKSLKANKVKGTVSSATSAKTAANALRLGGLAPSSYLRSSHVLNVRPFTLTDGQTRTVATDGPLSIVAWCSLNPTGDDQAGTYIRTTQDHSFSDAYDSSADFGPTDTIIPFGGGVDVTHGSVNIQGSGAAGVAVSPDGHLISSPGFLAGVNTPAFPHECVFAGTLILG